MKTLLSFLILLVGCVISAQAQLDTIDCSKHWYTVRVDSTLKANTLGLSSNDWRRDSVHYNDPRYGRSEASVQVQIRALSTYTGIDTLRVQQLFILRRMIGSTPVIDSVWLPVTVRSCFAAQTAASDSIILIDRGSTVTSTFHGTAVKYCEFTFTMPIGDAEAWRIERYNGRTGWKTSSFIYLDVKQRKG